MKTVDLIVANRVHEAATQIAQLPPDAAAVLAEPAKRDEAMRNQLRQLLRDVSHMASDFMVAKALGAIGGPTSADELYQRVTAAGEAQRREAAQ